MRFVTLEDASERTLTAVLRITGIVPSPPRTSRPLSVSSLTSHSRQIQPTRYGIHLDGHSQIRTSIPGTPERGTYHLVNPGMYQDGPLTTTVRRKTGTQLQHQNDSPAHTPRFGTAHNSSPTPSFATLTPIFSPSQ